LNGKAEAEAEFGRVRKFGDWFRVWGFGLELNFGDRVAGRGSRESPGQCSPTVFSGYVIGTEVANEMWPCQVTGLILFEVAERSQQGFWSDCQGGGIWGLENCQGFFFSVW
jgi:hypothetical protein